MTTTAATFSERNAASVRPVVLTGAAAGLVASCLTTYGAHDWPEILFTVPVIWVTTAVVFGYVVPRALRKDSAGGTALGLSIPAALLVPMAFWAGLPLVLGVAGLVVGNAGRTGRSGAGKCIAAVVLGAIAVLGYATIYVLDAGVSGNAGFLFD